RGRWLASAGTVCWSPPFARPKLVGVVKTSGPPPCLATRRLGAAPGRLILFDVFEAHGEDAGGVVRAHRDAVNAVGRLNRARVVGDDDELRLLLQRSQRLHKA